MYVYCVNVIIISETKQIIVPSTVSQLWEKCIISIQIMTYNFQINVTFI